MASTRDPWLDNAKMALVTLVVVGHLWALLPTDGLGGRLYNFVYLWHMPAFILVTGYLSRGFTWTPRKLWSLVTTLAVPYVLFEAALGLYRMHVGGEQLYDFFTDPHFPVWYLPALIAWRLLTPVFRPLWGGVVVAVAISLASGFLDVETLRHFDLARILGFLPFFVLGLKTTPERLELLRSRSAAWLGGAAFAVIAVLSLNLDRWADVAYLYYRPFDFIEASDQVLVLTRGLVVLVGMVGAIALLSVVPRRGGWFAAMGSATMIVYLFHGFAVKGVLYLGFDQWAQDHRWWSVLVSTVLGVAVALALAARPSRRALQHVVDPYGSAERVVDDAVRLAAVVREQERGEEQPAREELVSVGR